MTAFNSDVTRRLSVGIDLANALVDGTLPGRPDARPTAAFEAHGYAAPAESGEWDDVAAMTSQVSRLLRLVAEGEHETVVSQLNVLNAALAVAPFVEWHRTGGWSAHFHTTAASFAEGWEGGIAVALALGYSSGETHRIGICERPSCERFFLDHGKNRQRRYCSLLCQNRAKSSTYRARRRSGT